MGRIKTALTKRVTRELIKFHSNKFTDNFEENKKIVNTLISTPSKRLRNIIAGYVTKIIKRNKNTE